MLGSRIGNYRVVKKLGEGGMGVVYLGEHDSLGPGQRVAIKTLNPELCGNPELVQRFFQEARAATEIPHPAITRVFDFGHLPGGMAYIVMEFLHGESLAERLRARQRCSTEEIVRFGKQLTSVLGMAHAHGIVHRDLKPDNVFLSPDPDVVGGERVRILDFGIAKLAGDLSNARTRTGMVMGTPPYMSPEQCRGASAVDHRSDIYALGCVLFEMAAGRTPYVGEPGELIGLHLFGSLPDLRELNPAVPASLAAAIQRLLARRPEDRPQSMAEVANELGAASTSAVAGPSSPTLLASPTPPPAGPPAGVPGAPPTTTMQGAAAEVRGAPTARGRAWRRPVIAGGIAAVAVAVVVLATRGPVPTPAAPAADAAPALATAADAAPAPALATAAVDAALVVAAPVPDAAAPTCPTGQAITPDTGGHCCWAGQEWSVATNRCVGAPSACPEGLSVRASEQACARPHPCIGIWTGAWQDNNEGENSVRVTVSETAPSGACGVISIRDDYNALECRFALQKCVFDDRTLTAYGRAIAALGDFGKGTPSDHCVFTTVKLRCDGDRATGSESYARGSLGSNGRLRRTSQ